MTGTDAGRIAPSDMASIFERAKVLQPNLSAPHAETRELATDQQTSGDLMALEPSAESPEPAEAQRLKRALEGALSLVGLPSLCLRPGYSHCVSLRLLFDPNTRNFKTGPYPQLQAGDCLQLEDKRVFRILEVTVHRVLEVPCYQDLRCLLISPRPPE